MAILSTNCQIIKVNSNFIDFIKYGRIEIKKEFEN